MSERELLELLVQKVDGIGQEVRDVKQQVNALDQKVNKLEQEVGILKQEVGTLKHEMGELKQEVGTLKHEMGELKQEVGTLKQQFNEFKQEQRYTQITLEGVVDKCVQLLGEGYQSNFEMIDRLNLTSVNSKINQLEMITKINMNDVEYLKQKIG